MEKQPLSGKITDILQKRYIEKRIKWETATEDSTSEPVLVHLRQNGLVKGFIPAFREFQNMIDDAANDNGYELTNNTLFITSCILLGYASLAFLLTAAGVKPRGGIDNLGNWEFLSKAINKNRDYSSEID